MKVAGVVERRRWSDRRNMRVEMDVTMVQYPLRKEGAVGAVTKFNAAIM